MDFQKRLVLISCVRTPKPFGQPILIKLCKVTQILEINDKHEKTSLPPILTVSTINFCETSYLNFEVKFKIFGNQKCS